MSRTTSVEIKDNPAKLFLQWGTVKEKKMIDGEEEEIFKGGTFSYYDKEAKEKVPVKLPFRFAILNDELVRFSGYDEKRKRGVYSNEVRDKDHVVNIKTKEGTILSFKKGDYNKDNQTLKNNVKDFGAKFTQSVYIAVENEKGEWEIQNIQLSGAPLTGGIDPKNKKEDEKFDGWYNFLSNNKGKKYTHFVEVNKFKPKKKGTNKYSIPVYEFGEEIDAETSEKLNQLDRELNDYLEYVFASRKDDSVAPPIDEEAEAAAQAEPMPWE